MPRHILDLNGVDWRLGRAPDDALPDAAAWDELERVGDWTPAIVPGNVRADLMRAGRVPPLFPGPQAQASRWVEDHCWWLVRDLVIAPAADERVHLLLRGVDYVGDLYLNGHHLGRHEGMFSPQLCDVTALLGAENRLAVRIVGSRWLPQDRSSAWEKLLNLIEARASSMPEIFPHRRDLLKCQMGFGWDFAPPLRTMGIWDDVLAIVSGEVFIRQIAVRQHPVGDGVLLRVTVEVDGPGERSVRLRCRASGQTFEAEALVAERGAELPPGVSRHTIELVVPEPRLWWPWDHGRPDLYRLEVAVLAGDQVLDSVEQRVGLRQMALEDWTLRVNGRPVYARGANWVPADVLPGRVTEADYGAWLHLVRQANMNMVRVWGGGLREKRAFYDLCDRLGILVWQEFPFACAFLTRFPRTPAYLRLVEAEARAIVRDLRNHACLALWCGGNEFDPARNEPLVAALARAVDEEDGSRPFLPASPAPTAEGAVLRGDGHNWQVWHNYEPPSAYRQDTTRFASEFGLQAPPGVASLRRFVPQEDLWPPGPAWTYHHAGLPKLRRYARPFLQGRAPSLDDFVRASQQAQAHGLQIAIEHYRRRKAQGCGGVLLWQLNEPWPAISWAIVDHFRAPKPAYDVVKRLYAPLLVSLEYPLQRYRPGDRLRAAVWLVNDLASTLSGAHLEVTLVDGSGTGVQLLGQAVEAPGLSALVVGHIDAPLPGSGGWRLAGRLSQDGEILSENEYDLTVHDDILPTWRQRLWRWFTGLLLPA